MENAITEKCKKEEPCCKSIFKSCSEEDLSLHITKKWAELINLTEKMNIPQFSERKNR